ncbi:glycosyltransferase involved in cell wall biosynthesis [Thermodesulfitimonas autotrophica]|uniref:Glycosyltransferase involved in cell wall biosynthesis n=1 Tax=Thermodesulfitimonas autotrophica TaxID=1894989 RepID=A0A3N5AQ70_9THEO|nr:glycosyltransferase family 4 protein [Thermodesulfitimonas autotrophica]RPF47023.1 glycosyltransferase involved in cell wall biosynthesis [Thermodesulfitimonas autotrophica]
MDGDHPKVCLVSWTSFMPSRWQTVLYIRERYDVDFAVVAPPRAKISPVYDASGYLTPASVGLKDCPDFVTLIPLKDVERPASGFDETKLKAFLDHYKPDLLWIHGEPLQQVTRQICRWYFFSCSPRIYQAAVDNYQHLGRGPRAIKNRLLLHRITGFLASSKSTAYALEKDLKISRKKVFVTYLPNLPVERVSKPRSTNREFRIGFAGRLAPEKGILILLEALDFLPSEIKLFTAGAGEEYILHRLLANPRVHHMGLLQGLSALFSEIDLLVVPSLTTPRWKEQFGRVIAEAFSCGIPVVGSDSGSIPDVVGEGGLIYPEGSARALANRILEVYSDNDLYQRLSTNARVRFEEHFSVAGHARRLANIFNLSPRR